MGCIVPQTLQRGREAVVGGADTAAVPVADEVHPDQGLQLLNSHVLGVDAVIEQLTLHPGLHALTAGVVMTAATVAVHALADAMREIHDEDVCNDAYGRKRMHQALLLKQPEGWTSPASGRSAG